MILKYFENSFYLITVKICHIYSFQNILLILKMYRMIIGFKYNFFHVILFGYFLHNDNIMFVNTYYDLYKI